MSIQFFLRTAQHQAVPAEVQVAEGAGWVPGERPRAATGNPVVAKDTIE